MNGVTPPAFEKRIDWEKELEMEEKAPHSVSTAAGREAFPGEGQYHRKGE